MATFTSVASKESIGPHRLQCTIAALQALTACTAASFFAVAFLYARPVFSLVEMAILHGLLVGAGLRSEVNNSL